MKQNLVEVSAYEGPGYKALIYFENWRVALLNFDPEKFTRENVAFLERHNETDEVFVLLAGQCTLYIGAGKGGEPGSIESMRMEPNRLYNVKKGVWHNLSGSEDMVLLIVENADTSKANSDFCPVTTDMLPKD